MASSTIGVDAFNADFFYNISRFVSCKSLCALEGVCVLFRDRIQNHSTAWMEQFDHEKFPGVEGQDRHYKRDFQILYPITLSARRMKCLGEFVGKVPLLSEKEFNKLQDWDPYTVSVSSLGKRTHDQVFSCHEKKMRETFQVVVEPETIKRKYQPSRDRELLCNLIKFGDFKLRETDGFFKMESDKAQLQRRMRGKPYAHLTWQQYADQFLHVKDALFLKKIEPYLKDKFKGGVGKQADHLNSDNDVKRFSQLVETEYPAPEGCDRPEYLWVPYSLSNLVLLSLNPLYSAKKTPFRSSYFDYIHQKWEDCPKKVTVSFMRAKIHQHCRNQTALELKKLISKYEGFSLPSTRLRAFFNVIEMLNTGKCPNTFDERYNSVLTCDNEKKYYSIDSDDKRLKLVITADPNLPNAYVDSVPVYECGLK